MTHDELVKKAVIWLKRPVSAGGAGCQFAASELVTGHDGEIPDAWGFRRSYGGEFEGSVVVEVKVSRSDFLADKTKPHRMAGGVGDWRYYFAPDGMISPDDLPTGWGLVVVNARGHLSVKAGGLQDAKKLGHYAHMERMKNYRVGGDLVRERFMLAKLLSRVADPEQSNRWIKEANTMWQRSQSETDRLRERVRELELRIVPRGLGRG